MQRRACNPYSSSSLIFFLVPSDFLQMTGRAGRDGLPSRGVMFWAPKDITTLNFLANHTNGSEQADGRTAQQQAGANMAKIQEVQRFARQVGCVSFLCLILYLFMYLFIYLFIYLLISFSWLGLRPPPPPPQDQ